ncbi:efflux RND transporter periplasmic adaptor subunit [Micromonospora polyrhachis]|uniref:Multidrug resistance protein MdtA-like C-terminal permuted SH3 domain-containing protein n=1 Tax=Micromonospora polyrhachis TaxID=1282883 RepID=A0A7W7SR33_9ACTN|nr:hypothetical protein [Micromonospora polyrhachis]MBB4959410.1 hypothetical protein [Micromonospora polyrhachis]
MTAAVALAAGVTGWVLASRVQSPADAAAGRQPPAASLITVPVEQRALTATVVAQATVTYGTPQPITLTGTVAAGDGAELGAQLVTKTASGGRTLEEGDVLLEINGRPVFVLAGPVPMYRSLVRGSTGDDVQQLRAALRRLLPGRGVASYGPLDNRTLDALATWYDKKGYQAAGPTAAQRAELRQLQQAAEGSAATADAKAALAEFRATYGTTVPSGEVLFLPKLPVRLTTVTAKAGAAVSGPVGTVSDPTLVIDGTVATEDAELLKPGLTATVEAPSGETYPAKLSAMGAQLRASSDNTDEGESEQQVGLPIRLIPSMGAKLAPLAGQSVRVTIKVGGTGDDVLVVPVAAVFTAADGQAHVTVDSGGGITRDVPVEAGLTADGDVEVTPVGGGLEVGDRVVVSGS